MQRSSLLALAALAATNSLLAQDECTTATTVTVGTLTGQTNVGATTNPALPWGCGLGGNDVWYSFTTAGGTFVVNTCAGASFDTTLEVFDGSGGGACPGVSLGCNDDFCSLRSQLTVTLPAGTHFIRVGGFNSAVGTFDLTIGQPATVTSTGAGCGAQLGSFYESQAPAAFDLSGQTLTLTPAGGGYVCIVAPGTVQPVGSLGTASVVTLTDDSQAPAGTLGLIVGSNCWIARGPGNSNAFTPSIPTLLNNPSTAFYSWKDLNPAAAGSGQVQYEEAGTIARITYDGVFTFAQTTPNTIQFEIETVSGLVSITWGAMAANGTNVLVGYSAGGPSNDPGPSDVSTFSTTPIILPVDAIDLTLAGSTATPRPIQGAAASMFSVTTSAIPATALIHVGIIGISNPGLPLGPLLGATNCFLNASLDITVGPTFGPFPTGEVTWTGLSLPGAPPSFAGFAFSLQGAILGTSLNPALGLGLLTSNGLACVVGDL